MEIKKIYVNDNEKGTLICEKCGKTRVINFSDFKNIGKPLKVKCSCGYFFFVIIEVRKFYSEVYLWALLFCEHRDQKIL